MCYNGCKWHFQLGSTLIKYIECQVRVNGELCKEKDRFSVNFSQGATTVLSNIVYDASTGCIIMPATLWLIDLMADPSDPLENNLSSAKGITTYFQFLSDNKLEWNLFPSTKMNRPTYAFKRFIMSKVKAGECSFSTGNLWLGVVKRFYLWCIQKKLLNVDETNQPFIMTSRSVTAHGVQGRRHFDATSSDMRLPNKLKGSSGAVTHNSGIRTLSPMNSEARQFLKRGLAILMKPHVTLCVYLSLLCGLREDEALTLPRNEFIGSQAKDKIIKGHNISLLIGPQNGVNTKNGVTRDVEVPHALYCLLCDYAASECNLDDDTEVSGRLFLSNRGAPFNSAELTKRMSELRTIIKTVFGFELDHKYHDLRATYATEYGSRLLNSGMKYNDVFAEIKARLGHKFDKDTLKYMKIIQSESLRKSKAVELESFTQEILA